MWFKYNMAYCGTEMLSNAPTLNDIIAGLTDDELDEFNIVVGFQPGIDAFNNMQQELAAEAAAYQYNNRIRLEAFIIFFVGSTLLFIFARYGDLLRDFLWNMLPTTTEVVEGLAAGMRRLGRAAVYREQAAHYAQALLNDPNTAARVVNGLRRVQEIRQGLGR